MYIRAVNTRMVYQGNVNTTGSFSDYAKTIK